MALCTGCSVCVEQCLCHAMDMVAELAPVVVRGPAPIIAEILA